MDRSNYGFDLVSNSQDAPLRPDYASAADSEATAKRGNQTFSLFSGQFACPQHGSDASACSRYAGYT